MPCLKAAGNFTIAGVDLRGRACPEPLNVSFTIAAYFRGTTDDEETFFTDITKLPEEFFTKVAWPSDIGVDDLVPVIDVDDDEVEQMITTLVDVANFVTFAEPDRTLTSAAVLVLPTLLMLVVQVVSGDLRLAVMLGLITTTVLIVFAGLLAWAAPLGNVITGADVGISRLGEAFSSNMELMADFFTIRGDTTLPLSLCSAVSVLLPVCKTLTYFCLSGGCVVVVVETTVAGRFRGRPRRDDTTCSVSLDKRDDVGAFVDSANDCHSLHITHFI